MPRTVTLVLVDGAGDLLGVPEPFVVAAPWWQEVADVVAAARDRTGFQLSVLRLLTAEQAHPPGGAVTYLAEVQSLSLERLDSLMIDPVPAPLARAALRTEPMRAPWAEPGGPGRSVAWARAELLALGKGSSVRAEQQRAWNLSAIWRLESSTLRDQRSVTWLKQVPAFFAHEAAVLRWLGRHAPGAAVVLLAADGHGRALLEHVDGEDAYGCGTEQRDVFASLLHRIQTTAIDHVPELIELGVPDRRGSSLIDHIRGALSQFKPDVSRVSNLLDDLPERLAAVEACGMSNTLVHGDFHPGNVRAQGARATLLDWGDSFVGHPAFDILRLIDGCDDDASRFLVEAWSQRWRARLRNIEPERAIELLRPVNALRQAAVYALFCSRIEPSEHPFHAADVARCLDDAACAWRASAGT
jgi:hypothetical protein